MTIEPNTKQAEEKIVRKKVWTGNYDRWGYSESTYIDVKVKNEPEYSVPLLHFFYGSSHNVDGLNLMSLNKLIDFQWQIALGDDLISQEEFRELLKQGSGLVRFRDSFVHLDPAEVEKLLKQLSADPNKKITHPLHIILAEEYDGARIHIDDDLRKILNDLTQIGNVPLPTGLKATLRPYQQRGYDWLYKNTLAGLGSILADDMGLGKTILTIALLLKLKEEGKLEGKQCLIVCPTTLLTNWSKELERFAPELSYTIYHSSQRKQAPPNAGAPVNILLTSFGLVRSEQCMFTKLHFPLLVIDEAQNIKNSSAEQSKAIKSLKADICIALSGTPVENRLSEYWSIFDFTNNGWLGNLKYFNDYFSKPIQIERDQSKLRAFRNITAPLMMRRLKSDKTIISDLPDKVEHNMFPHLTPTQASLYETVVKESLKILEEQESGIERQGLILKMMTTLKQICNHPMQYTKKTSTQKPEPDQSGKVPLLFDILEPVLDNDEKVLIFTQYTEMGEMLCQFLHERFGVAPLYLHGGLTRAKRDEMVEQFNTNPHQRIFILSLKAGGTGLNLTRAQHVVHFDLWWNPAVEAQATDRAYRIGQKKNVMVYRFVTKGTLEEKIDDMIRAKKDLADMTVVSGEKWIGDLSNAELKELVKLTQ